MSVTIRPYRGGGWEVDIRVVTPDGTRHMRERKRAPISSRIGCRAMGCGPGTRAVRSASLSAKGSTTQGGAHPTRIRAAIRRRPRTGESTEAERDCIEDRDPSAVPDPGVRSKTARRDQERGRAAVESAARDQVAKDGEQHSRRAQHPAEEGGGVGCDRADAVHGSSCCPSRRAQRRSTTSRSTSGSSTSHGQSISGRT